MAQTSPWRAIRGMQPHFHKSMVSHHTVFCSISAEVRHWGDIWLSERDPSFFWYLSFHQPCWGQEQSDFWFRIQLKSPSGWKGGSLTFAWLTSFVLLQRHLLLGGKALLLSVCRCVCGASLLCVSGLSSLAKTNHRKLSASFFPSVLPLEPAHLPLWAHTAYTSQTSSPSLSPVPRVVVHQDLGVGACLCPVWLCSLGHLTTAWPSPSHVFEARHVCAATWPSGP